VFGWEWLAYGILGLIGGIFVLLIAMAAAAVLRRDTATAVTTITSWVVLSLTILALFKHGSQWTGSHGFVPVASWLGDKPEDYHGDDSAWLHHLGWRAHHGFRTIQQLAKAGAIGGFAITLCALVASFSRQPIVRDSTGTAERTTQSKHPKFFFVTVDAFATITFPSMAIRD